MKTSSVLEPKKNAGHAARLGLLAALLIAAGVLFWQKVQLPISQEPPEEVITSPAPTVSGREVRELSYEKDAAAVRDQAAEQLARMVQNHQTELAIEEALQKAGYLPALVIMQNDSLTINVGARELSGPDSMTILSICVAHSDVPSENIRIMNGPSS